MIAPKLLLAAARNAQEDKHKHIILRIITRISDLNTRSFAIGKVPRRTWAMGDYIVGRYVTDEEDTGKECQVELSNGNLQTLHKNDLVVGALGDRVATNEVVGTWQLIGSETNEIHHPDNTVMNMLCGSGIFGIETSRCSKHPQSPINLYMKDIVFGSIMKRYA